MLKGRATSHVLAVTLLSLLVAVSVSNAEPSRLGIPTLNVSSYLAASESPCEDALFLELKKKPLSELTEREYEYFQQKDKDCSEYQKLMARSNTETQQARGSSQQSGMGPGSIVLLAIAGTVVFLVVLGALAQ